MGNKNPKEENSTIIENQEFALNHPKLKTVTFKKTQNREFMETHLPIANNKDYDLWAKALKDSPANQSEYSLKPDKHDFKKGGMCGNGGTSSIQYQLQPILLSQESKDRGTNYFNEPELWYLLYGLADVGSKFHQKGQKAGDIRPINIFLSEGGRVRVATQHSWPGETTSYEKYFYENQKAYLSPEEVQDVATGRTKPEGNFETSESFSVGLTWLETALLNKCEDLYNKQNFNFEELEALRQRILNHQTYSDLFKLVMLSLTERQPEARETCSQISKWLKPHEHKILGMEPFTVNQLPPRVQKMADRVKLPRRTMNFDERSFINKLESHIPNPIDHQPVHTGYQSSNINWDAIDEKIRKSKQMFPTQ